MQNFMGERENKGVSIGAHTGQAKSRVGLWIASRGKEDSYGSWRKPSNEKMVAKSSQGKGIPEKKRWRTGARTRVKVAQEGL